jgi:hypothetical protein
MKQKSPFQSNNFINAKYGLFSVVDLLHDAQLNAQNGKTIREGSI